VPEYIHCVVFGKSVLNKSFAKKKLHHYSDLIYDKYIFLSTTVALEVFMLINIGTMGPDRPHDPFECEVDCTLLSGQAQVPLDGTRRSRVDCTLQIILQLN